MLNKQDSFCPRHCLWLFLNWCSNDWIAKRSLTREPRSVHGQKPHPSLINEAFAKPMLGIPRNPIEPTRDPWRSNLTLWPIFSLLAPPPRRVGGGLRWQSSHKPHRSPWWAPWRRLGRSPWGTTRQRCPRPPSRPRSCPASLSNRPDSAKRLQWSSLASLARRPSALTARPSPTPRGQSKARQGKARRRFPDSLSGRRLRSRQGRSPLLDGAERSK